MIRALLVDDQQLIRSGFALILGVEDDIEVVGEASNGREAVALVRALKPDVVLMDVQMPVLDGIVATREIVATESARVLILTTFDRDDYVFEGLAAGASGFLLKNSDADHLIDAVRTVASGNALLAPEVTSRVIAKMTATRASRARDASLESLTPREREVLELVGRVALTLRSPQISFSAKRRLRPTCPTPSQSSTCVTVCTQSCTPTKPDSSARGTGICGHLHRATDPEVTQAS